jgi:hypothetical protein
MLHEHRAEACALRETFFTQRREPKHQRVDKKVPPAVLSYRSMILRCCWT